MSMVWTNDDIQRLRTLWADPANSTAWIGVRMGISKNAVVGKAHRLMLPARPSPIRFADPARVRPAPRAKPLKKSASTLPALEGAASCAAPVGVALPQQPTPAQTGLDQPIPPVVLAGWPATKAADRPPCAWPMWGNGRATHVYCGEPSAPRDEIKGPSYCARHRALSSAKMPPATASAGRAAG